MVALSLAGHILPSDCLPVTLQVGYNHAPAPEGAVYAAAEAGDVPALQAALDAGGSTEEADEVSDDRAQGRTPLILLLAYPRVPRSMYPLPLYCSVAALVSFVPHTLATSTPFDSS